MDPFAASVISIACLALLDLPIGHAMIASLILYLMLAGLDMGTAAEQLLNGMFSSYILLAVRWSSTTSSPSRTSPARSASGSRATTSRPSSSS